jgi:ribosomal protein L40E
MEARVCPRCGARNAPNLEWCGQCFERFSEREPRSPGPSADMPGQPAARVPPAPPGGEGASGPAQREWECRRCGQLYSIEANECPACGTPIVAAVSAALTSPAEVEPSTAAGWSLVFPGLGHGKAGQGVLGLAIGLLAATALAFAVVVGLAAGRRVAGSLLLLLVLAIWLVAALDAYHWAQGRPDEVLLRPRVVSVLAGVTLLIFLFGISLAMGSG